jgi:hypothetical protein
MAAYTCLWSCWICDKRQETMDPPNPKHKICEDCLRPLATALMHAALTPYAKLSDPGVNASHFMQQADDVARVLFQRWAPR